MVIDFGIAKATHQRLTEKTLFTDFAQMIGTPAYMSPEQAQGDLERVDERSDVWGLGAVLYELLTGRPPFLGGTAGEVLAAVVARPLRPVRENSPEAPPELAAIAEKALQKDRARRYQTAKELAADVESFMSGARISSYSYSSWELLRRFVQRNRVLTGAVAAGLALVLASSAVIFRAYREAELERGRARASERQATASLALSLVEGAEAAFGREDPLEARARVRAALELFDSLHGRALWQRLAAAPLRHRLARDEMFYAVAIAPGGELLATGGASGRVRLVNLATGTERDITPAHESILDLAFVDGGKRLLSAGLEGRVAEWDVETLAGRDLLSVPRVAAWRLALAPDGALLAVAFADGQVWLYDRRSGTGRLLGRHGGSGGAGLFFAGMGAVLSGGADGLRRFRVEGEPEEGERVPGFDQDVASLAASADGAAVALGHPDGHLVLWRPATGERRTLSGHAGRVRSLAFDPRGKALASGAKDGARLWDLERLDSVPLAGHTDAVYGVTFDPSGRLLASASIDRSVRVVDGAVAALQRSTRHTDRLHGVAFSPDGQLLATSSADLTVRLWHAASGASRVLAPATASIGHVAFDPSGKKVVAWGDDRARREIDLETAQVTQVLQQASHGPLIFSPDGKASVAVVDGRLRWAPREGGAARVFEGPARTLQSLAYSGDGQRVASTEGDGSVRVWEVRSGKSKLLGQHGRGAHGVAFHPGGEWVASGGADRTVRLWNVASGQQYVLEANAAAVWVVRFSADGALLGASGSSVAAVTLWDTRDLSRPPPLARTLGEDGANELDFSRDGLVAASADRDTVRVWRTDGTPHWRAPALLPLASPCLAWPELAPAALEAASRAGLGRELARRPAACRLEGELGRCAGAARQPSAFDARHVALACEGGLAVFDLASRKAVLRAPPARSFAVAEHGLLRLGEDGALALRPLGRDADAWSLGDVSAFAAGEGRVGAVVGGEVVEVDVRSGEVRARLGPIEAGPATALAKDGDAWVVGLASGEVRALLPGGAVVRRPFASAEVTALAAAEGLVVIGHANGALAAWLPREDRIVWADHLHGGVAALHLVGGEVLALSELGDWRRLPLESFQQSWCALLEDVWAQAPSRWEGGKVERAGRPQAHACAGRAN